MQGAKNYVEYKDRVFIYYYRLSIIFKEFNQAKLKLLFLINLLLFYDKLDKKIKKWLKNVFELVYYQIEQKLINLIMIKIEIRSEIPIKDKYYDKYHLAKYDFIIYILLFLYIC